jgi:hypothetical protein
MMTTLKLPTPCLRNLVKITWAAHKSQAHTTPGASSEHRKPPALEGDSSV